MTHDGLIDEMHTAPTGYTHFLWADALRTELRSYGYSSALYGAELSFNDFAYPVYFVKVGRFYCDISGSTVQPATQTRWTYGEIDVEVMGELKTLTDMCDFNNLYVPDEARAAGAGQ